MVHSMLDMRWLLILVMVTVENQGRLNISF